MQRFYKMHAMKNEMDTRKVTILLRYFLTLLKRLSINETKKAQRDCKQITDGMQELYNKKEAVNAQLEKYINIKKERLVNYLV